MSTNSMIGIKKANGLVDGVYCHWDGYVEGVGEYLNIFYRDIEQIRALISCCNYISSVGPVPNPVLGNKYDKEYMDAYSNKHDDEDAEVKKLYLLYHLFVRGQVASPKDTNYDPDEDERCYDVSVEDFLSMQEYAYIFDEVLQEWFVRGTEFESIDLIPLTDALRYVYTCSTRLKRTDLKPYKSLYKTCKDQYLRDCIQYYCEGMDLWDNYIAADVPLLNTEIYEALKGYAKQPTPEGTIELHLKRESDYDYFEVQATCNGKTEDLGTMYAQWVLYCALNHPVREYSHKTNSIGFADYKIVNPSEFAQKGYVRDSYFSSRNG